MRQNKINNFLGYSGYKSPWLSYTTIYILTLISSVYVIIFGPPGTSADTFDYLAASKMLEHGELHMTRPPLYPAIMLLLRNLFGEIHLFKCIIVLQYIFFIVAIFYFSKTARLVLKSDKAAFWTSAVFALLPSFTFYNRDILTESFTLSFVIFFVWTLLYKLPEIPGIRSVLYSGFWLLALIFLRPVMMCFIPVYIIFWGYVALRWRRKALRQIIVAVCVLVATGSTILAYKHCIFIQYGLKSMSASAITNNYYALRDLHLMRPEYTDNPLLKSFLDSVCDISPRSADQMHANWDEIILVRRLSTPLEREIAVSKAMADNPLAYIHFANRNLGYLSKHALLPGFRILPQRLEPYPLPVDMSCYLVFMTMALILLIWKGRHIGPWILFLSTASISGASTIGAMDEWTRLFFPGMACALLLGSYIFLPAFRAWRRGL